MPGDCRYVVLHHTGIGEPHFDLMIEIEPGAGLATWRLPNWPPQAGDLFTPLAEHRRDYLEYEGKISGGRGQVRRMAAGHCCIAQATGRQFAVNLDDNQYLLLPV